VVLRCHGELAAATAELQLLRGQDTPSEPDDAARATHDWATEIEAELGRDIAGARKMLERCLDAEKQAYAQDPKSNLAASRLMIGECFRRLGDDPTASKVMRRLRVMGTLPEWAVLVMHDTAFWTGDQTPRWASELRAEWNSRVDAMVTGLSQPDDVERASESLSLLADAGARKSIVSALTGDDEAAATGAALAITGYENPGEEALTTLERAVADPEGDVELRWQGIETLVLWGRRSSAPAFRAVLAEDDDFILEPALRGIGLTGGPQDVAAILKRSDEEPEAAALALSLLTGETFETVEGFSSWAEENAEKDRWIDTALRDAGATADSLATPAAVPELIELLAASALPIRWNAFRRLRAITGQDFAVHQVRYVGRAPSPESPDAELDLEMVRGDGWTVSYGPLIDMEALGPLVQPVRDRDGRIRWRRARARWAQYWKENAPK